MDMDIQYNSFTLLECDLDTWLSHSARWTSGKNTHDGSSDTLAVTRSRSLATAAS